MEDGQANGCSLIRRLATAGVEDLNKITMGKREDTETGRLK